MICSEIVFLIALSSSVCLQAEDYSLLLEPLIAQRAEYRLILSEEKPEVQVKPNRQVLFFTKAGCLPCQKVKREVLPELRKAGYSIGESEFDQVRIVDHERNPELFRKHQAVRVLPTFLLIENGKWKIYHEGFYEAKQLKAMLQPRRKEDVR